MLNQTSTQAEAVIRDVHRMVPTMSLIIEDAAESGDTIWGVPDRFDLMARTGVLEGLAGPARNPKCAEAVR